MPDIDPREIAPLTAEAARKSSGTLKQQVLANVPAGPQRVLLEQAMNSQQWNMVQIHLRADELEKEVRRLRARGAEGERAIAQRDKALAKAKAAEKRAAAAERQADKERFARRNTEGELEGLKEEIRKAVASESRLERLAKDNGL